MSVAKKYLWPRERLASQGVANLKDEDLLALILRTGSTGKNVLALSAATLKKRSLVEWSHAQLEDWLAIPGIDLAKAAALVAAFELSARTQARNQLPHLTITTPSAAASQFQHLRTKKKEYLAALYLNARYEVIHQEIISIGTVDRSLIHPREVFAPALTYLACSLIIAHNHPSGNSEPSAEDLAVTRTLAEGARLLQLTLIDHLILTSDKHLSLREWGVVELQSSELTINHSAVNPTLTRLVGEGDTAGSDEHTFSYTD